jgi:hypothetical protein
MMRVEANHQLTLRTLLYPVRALSYFSAMSAQVYHVPRRTAPLFL